MRMKRGVKSNSRFYSIIESLGMSKSRRSQISVFVIIAVLLIVAVFIFYLKTNRDENAIDSAKIKNFVENCIKETGKSVIYKIGEGGGYYSTPEFSTDTGIAYYYSNGKSHMPLKSDIEKEISLYVSKELSNCTGNFSDFPDFNVAKGEINVKTKIERESVILNLDYPLSISKEGKTIKLDKFRSVIPARFGVLYDSADEIIKEQLSHDGICLTCLMKVSMKNNFKIDMDDYEEDTTIFFFRDEKINEIGNTEEEVFKLVFANKYELKEI